MIEEKDISINLSENDIKFISKKTKLSRKKLLPLLEEKGDVLLILEQISKNCSKRQMKKLSFDTYSKIIILKYSSHKEFEMNEKMYISNSISKYYPEIVKKRNIKIKLPNKPDPNIIKFCIVLFGCFCDKKNSQYSSYLDDGLRKNGHRDIAVHIDDWLNIMDQIKKDGWL